MATTMNQQRPSRREIAQAIRLVQQEIRWKPNSAQRHLRKRINRGHLLPDATLRNYETIIKTCVTDKMAQTYLFWYEGVPYVAVVTLIYERHWLVMFDLRGLLESAYVVKRPQHYLNKSYVDKIGTLDEVTSNEL